LRPRVAELQLGSQSTVVLFQKAKSLLQFRLNNNRENTHTRTQRNKVRKCTKTTKEREKKEKAKMFQILELLGLLLNQTCILRALLATFEPEKKKKTFLSQKRKTREEQ
jgi:hypothetical protein